MQHRMTLTFTSTGELETSPISKNAIFLFNNKNLLQAHSANVNISINSEFFFAKRACKYKTKQHQENFKGTFAA